MNHSIKAVVREVFLQTNEGRSTEDVVIDDDLNQRFTDACCARVPSATPFDCNWALFQVRKSAGLGPVAKRRGMIRHGEYLHAAEIAARRMEDKFGLNIDRVICDPHRRREFDSIALGLAPEVSTFLLRKAALHLRKNRQFKPELIKRVASWDRAVSCHSATALIANPELLPRSPGVYIFSDTSGYLYIGEAENLRLRVAKHLDHSDRKALARYFWDMDTRALQVELHVFNPTSDGRKKQLRRAYEADLIRSRQPRFNIQESRSTRKP